MSDSGLLREFSAPKARLSIDHRSPGLSWSLSFRWHVNNKNPTAFIPRRGHASSGWWPLNVEDRLEGVTCSISTTRHHQTASRGSHCVSSNYSFMSEYVDDREVVPPSTLVP